jgi:shikimate kinase
MLPQNVLLIGYRGTGKTTVARLLAALLGWDWADSDQVLEKKHGRSIKTIFVEEGESGFRDKEATVLAELCRGTRQVIATGGGAILRPDNRVLMKQSGFVVWLTADAVTIHARLQADPTTAGSRPELTNRAALDEIRQLLAEREPLYRTLADLEIDAARLRPEDVAGEILKRLEAT